MVKVLREMQLAISPSDVILALSQCQMCLVDSLFFRLWSMHFIYLRFCELH